MENLRNRVDVRLVANSKDCQSLVSKPSFASRKILIKNLAQVYKIKDVLTHNKPAYADMDMLDLTKTSMYNFHYNCIKKKCVHETKLFLKGADRLTYEIEINDAFEDIYKDKTSYIVANIQKMQNFLTAIKKVTNTMKDETKDVPTVELVELSVKCIHSLKKIKRWQNGKRN